jgi:hypothetical protein
MVFALSTASVGVPFVVADNAPFSPFKVVGIPLCDGQQGRPAHDPTKWHPLVARGASGQVICTYGHEHGMQPSGGDAVFGPLRVPGGQEISYPWATQSAGVTENGPDIKHRSYKWEVATNLPCDQGQEVTAFRGEFHNDGNLGAAIRFHSFWLEAQLTECNSHERGYISIGGHMDYGQLHTGDQTVSEGGDPTPSCILNGDLRQEGLVGGREQSNSVWYGANNRSTAPGSTTRCDDDPGLAPHIYVNVNVGTNSWGPVDPNDPSALHFYDDQARHNGTQTGTDALGFRIDPSLADSTGRINFQGFVTRSGVVRSACAPLGQDCIPVTIRNARPGPYSSGLDQHPVVYNGDVPGPHNYRSYYVQTPNQTH